MALVENLDIQLRDLVFRIAGVSTFTHHDGSGGFTLHLGTDFTKTGAGTFTELAGGNGYTQQTLTVADDGTANNYAWNSGQISFGTWSGSQTTATHWAVKTVTGTKLIMGGTLDAPRVLNNGTLITVDANQFKYRQV